MFCSDCNNTLSFYHVFWNNILSCGSAVVGTCCWTSVHAMTVWLTRWCRSDWARWANGWPSTERPSTARGPGRTRTIQSTPMSGEAFTLPDNQSWCNLLLLSTIITWLLVMNCELVNRSFWVETLMCSYQMLPCLVHSMPMDRPGTL